MLPSEVPTKYFIAQFIFCFIKSVQTEVFMEEPKYSFENTNSYPQYYHNTRLSNIIPKNSISRDSMMDSAYAGTISSIVSSGQPMMMYHYHVQPTMGSSSGSSSYRAPSHSYGKDMEEDEKGGGGSGHIGLLGLLGLKGLKGVKAVKAIKAAAVLAPIIGPILAPLLPIIAPLFLLPLILPLALPVLLIVAILFLPIINVGGGRTGHSVLDMVRGANNTTFSKDDGCMDRISCEILKATNLYE